MAEAHDLAPPRILWVDRYAGKLQPSVREELLAGARSNADHELDVGRSRRDGERTRQTSAAPAQAPQPGKHLASTSSRRQQHSYTYENGVGSGG
ncbi:MAG: hypothetical protein M3O50_08515 [Myxococcota bacterium]|nr:hypothetical protein [Myxococcota bacterium]